jgi:predicted alternative tryptophan synthase beta-subunit
MNKYRGKEDAMHGYAPGIGLCDPEHVLEAQDHDHQARIEDSGLFERVPASTPTAEEQAAQAAADEATSAQDSTEAKKTSSRKERA